MDKKRKAPFAQRIEASLVEKFRELCFMERERRPGRMLERIMTEWFDRYEREHGKLRIPAQSAPQVTPVRTEGPRKGQRKRAVDKGAG